MESPKKYMLTLIWARLQGTQHLKIQKMRFGLPGSAKTAEKVAAEDALQDIYSLGNRIRINASTETKRNTVTVTLISWMLIARVCSPMQQYWVMS